MIKGPGKNSIITRPLFYYGLALAAGVALGMTGLFGFTPSLIILALGVLSVIAAKKYGYAAPLGLFLALGIFLSVSDWHKPKPFPVAEGEEIIIEGLVLKNSLSNEAGGFSLSLRPESVNSLPYFGGDVLLYGEGPGSYLYGDRLTARGRVMPYSLYGNENAFDYESYLLKQGYSGRISAAYGGEITLINRGEGNFIGRLASKIRLRLDKAIEQIPHKQGQYIKGVFLGEKSDLSAYEKRTLAQAGILHAFAVSGLHVGYIVALAGLVFGGSYKRRWPRLIIGAVFLLFYLFIVGFKASVLRASIMAALFLIAPVFNEKADLLNSWGLALILVLLWKPLQILDAGFQLSFITVAGIGLLQPVFYSILPGPKWLKNSFAVTFAASFASMPVVAWYFNLASWGGWVLSQLFLLIIGLVVILALVGALFSLFSIGLASLFLISAGFFMEIVYKTADFVSQLGFSWLALGRPGFLVLIVYFSIMPALPKIGRLWGKKGVYITALFLILLLILPFGNNQGPAPEAFKGSEDLLEVVFLDVGQGDCAIVFTPRGNTVVIDGGGKTGDLNWAGDNILAPFLHGRKIKQVELLINSHPHEDHIGGLFSLLQMFKVRGVMVSAPCGEIDLQEEFIFKASEKGCEIFQAQAGESYLLEEDLYLDIFSPDTSQSYTASNANEGSLVMKLKYKDISFLFTGDIEGRNLEALVPLAQIKADILKLPHHGSISSMNTDFYRRVAPEAVVVSVGKNNPFGHPSPVISDYWQDMGVPFYKTSKNGAITVFSDGKLLQVKTMY